MSKTFRAGAARADITPDYCVDLAGYAARVQPATGVLDPIYARAAVFEADGRRIVIISLDVLELTRPDADVLRQTAADHAGTSADCVCIACTHTHSSPAAYPLKEAGRFSQRFVDDLHERVPQVARAAALQLKPARLAVGSAELQIAGNRRANLRGDRGGPTGQAPAEDRLRALVVSDDTGSPACAILNYACHAVCLPPENRGISGDFPGAASRELEKAFGHDAVVMFVNGCAGDINPRGEFRGSAAHMTEAAGKVVRAAEEILRDLSHEQDPAPGLPLAAETLVVPLPYEPGAEGGQAFMTVCVQRLVLGPVEIVALSGEVLFEIGLEIRRRAGRPDLWVAAYCNGGHGYVPTDAALREGGYEPDSSNYYYDRPALRAGGAEKLIDQAVRLINR